MIEATTEQASQDAEVCNRIIQEYQDSRLADLTLKERSIARAKNLLAAADAYEGDHGFTEEALVTWINQRKVYLDALKTIADGGTPSEAQHTAVRYANCPQAYERELGQTVHGTLAGQAWASMARETIQLMWY